jgi:hypothetical protein
MIKVVKKVNDDKYFNMEGVFELLVEILVVSEKYNKLGDTPRVVARSF